MCRLFCWKASPDAAPLSQTQELPPWSWRLYRPEEAFAHREFQNLP